MNTDFLVSFPWLLIFIKVDFSSPSGEVVSIFSRMGKVDSTVSAEDFTIGRVSTFSGNLDDRKKQKEKT